MKNKLINAPRKSEEDDEFSIALDYLSNSRVCGNILTVFYNGPITEHLLQFISNELNVAEQRYSDLTGNICTFDEFALVLSSPGGDATMITSFCPMMKSMGLKQIYVIGQCSSAALAIILDCKKEGIEIFMDKFCNIIFHRVMSTCVGELRSERIRRFTDTNVKQFEKLFDEINKPLLDKIDKQSASDYKNGHDVYFIGLDLIEMGLFKEFKTNILGVENGKSKKRKSTKKK
jgi:ATP-dependent protease ClpP protease subunit